MAMSAREVTGWVTAAASFAASGSGVALPTCEASVSGPVWAGSRPSVSWTVDTAPGARRPSAQSTRPPATVQVPVLEVAAATVVPAGTGVRETASTASDGPLLTTEIT